MGIFGKGDRVEVSREKGEDFKMTVTAINHNNPRYPEGTVVVSGEMDDGTKRVATTEGSTIKKVK